MIIFIALIMRGTQVMVNFLILVFCLTFAYVNCLNKEITNLLTKNVIFVISAYEYVRKVISLIMAE